MTDLTREEAEAAIAFLEAAHAGKIPPEHQELAAPAGFGATLLPLARAGYERLFAGEEVVEKVARVIREEIVRQYRDDERRSFPGGSRHYEETQSPWLIARAVLAAMKE